MTLSRLSDRISFGSAQTVLAAAHGRETGPWLGVKMRSEGA